MRAKDALELPFDQYQRYRLVADLIRQLFASSRPQQILDIGGADGILSRYLQPDRITVLDPGDLRPPDRWVRGSGSAAPFRDASFDLILSIDTFEHLEAADRTSMVGEMSRLARRGGILAAPFDEPGVREVEAVVEDLHRGLHRSEHPFLTEHRMRGLPSLTSAKELLEARGWNVRVLPNGTLVEWLAGMLLSATLEGLPSGDDARRTLDRLVNRCLYPASNREPAYRRFVIYAQRDLADLEPFSGDVKPPTKRELRTLRTSLQRIVRSYRSLERHARRSEKQALRKGKRLDELEPQLRSKDEEIAGLESHLRHQDEQLRALCRENRRGIEHRQELDGQLKESKRAESMAREHLTKLERELRERDAEAERREEAHSGALREVREQYARLEEAYRKLQAAHEGVQEEAQTLRKRIEESQAASSTLEERFRERGEELESIRSSLRGTEAECSSLEDLNRELTGALEAQSRRLEELEELCPYAEKLRAELEAKEGLIREIEEYVRRLESERGARGGTS